MQRQEFSGKKGASLLAIGVIALLIVIIGISKYASIPEKRSGLPDSQQAQIEAARQEGYDRGYAVGYEAAKTDTAATYQEGYKAAQKEIGNRTFTRSGITGFIVGLLVSVGGVAFLTRKTLSTEIKALRKEYELKKAFKSIPADLPSDVSSIAEQIARAYAEINGQLRTKKGYLVTQYVSQWRLKLDELMGKAVQVMELIQDLEAARASVNETTLAYRIEDLKYTARRAKDDETRNAAVKSLRQAKQTHKDLQTTLKNLDRCKETLREITRVLESMRLKISNLKVTTQEKELLDELSSDLEQEMNFLEEALHEFKNL